MPAKAKANGTGSLAPLGHPGSAALAIEDFRCAVATASSAALKEELARLLGLTAENLLKLAIVVKELEDRGESLDGLKLGLLPLLRKIAAGQLLPEIVVLYAGQPHIIAKVARMPIVEQERVARQEYIVDDRTEYKPKPRTPKESGSGGLPAINTIAASSSPKDVAGMAAALILNSLDRKTVLAELLSLLAKENVIPATVANLVGRSLRK